MKWKDPLGIIVIGAGVGLIALTIYGMVTWIITQRNGHKVQATVTAVPVNCGRVNSINVTLNGTTYRVKISRAACREGRYQVGQQVTLWQHPDYKELVWPNSRPGIVIALIIGLCLLIFFQYRSKKA